MDRTGRAYGFHYNVLGIADDFRADNGFVPRTGFVQPNIFNRWVWYGAPGRFQNAAVSVSQISWTTSVSSFAIASKVSLRLGNVTAGF